MLFDLALYLHLLALLAAFGASAVGHYLAARQRRAASAEELLRFVTTMQAVARVFPVASLVLLASGFYMSWRLSTLSAGWVWAAVVGLVLIGGVGDGIVGKHQKELAEEVTRAGLSARARTMLEGPVGRVAPVTVDALVLGVVWLMVARPSLVESVVTLVVAILVGVGAPLAMIRRGQPAPKVTG